MDLRQQSEQYLAHLLDNIDLFSQAAPNPGELAAFIAFALAYPNNFVAVIDTYNTLLSGLPNFCAVALCLISMGYRPIGLRLDSGDLMYLSAETRKVFDECSDKYKWAKESFDNMAIILSNDLTEQTLAILNCGVNDTCRNNPQRPQNDINETFEECLPTKQTGKRAVTACGIGTHLVTCYKQPALGMVFKLVEINGRPVIKLSEDIQKMSIPGAKSLYRLYGRDGVAICDLMQCPSDPAPCVDAVIFVRDPFIFSKRANVVPSIVECLLNLYWSNGQRVMALPSLKNSRHHCLQSIKRIRDDNTRLVNPRPYKVSLSGNMYKQTQKLLEKILPLAQLN